MGGQVLLAGKVRWRADLNTIIIWLENECQILGVDIRFNHLAESDDVLRENPDVAIIATGGTPNTDWIKGNATVVSSWDALSGIVPISGSVLIHDLTGRNTAMAVADLLSEQGADVTLNTQDAHFRHGLAWGVGHIIPAHRLPLAHWSSDASYRRDRSMPWQRYGPPA